jgi:acetyltransferase-like isoleucine patch superfamily enzyme
MFQELLKIFEGLIRNIDGRTGQLIRSWYYGRRLKRCGKDVIIDVGVVFQNPGSISLSDNIWIDRYAVLIAGKFLPGKRKFIEKLNSDFVGQAGDLSLASGVHVAPFVVLQAHGGLTIGKNVTIASGARVYTLSHHYRNLANPLDEKRYSFSSMASPDDQFLIVAPVVIADNAAVGLNSVVLPGSTIQPGAWVGALQELQGQTEANKIYSSNADKRKVE